MPYRKISWCQQNFIDLIYKLAEICNLELTDYVIEMGCDEIDSFLCGMFKVQLRGKRDGQKLRKVVMIKWHPEPKMRSKFRELYIREYVFYQRVMPQLLEIQKCLKNIEGLKLKFPNCILANAEHGNETIAVMAVRDGFVLRDRLQNLNLEHVSLVMKNLAKLHALSFVLEKTNPKEFEEIARLCHKDVQYSNPGVVPKIMRSYYDASVNVVIEAIARDKLKALAPDIMTVLYKCTLPNSYSTICHGDCWNNNILFKHKANKPVEILLIDYQLCRYASPVTDISYFLYMSTDKAFLNKHYCRVIDIYYGTLTAVLRHCNLDVNEIYPRSIFEKHLREYSVLGLIEALVAMMIITAPFEEALKMTAMKYEHCDDELPEEHYQEHSLFVERVNGIVGDFFERDYLLDAFLK